MVETIAIGALQLRFLRDKDATAGSLDMFEMQIPPEAGMPVPHYHDGWDETVYGLSGTATFTIDGYPVDVGPGETAFIPRGHVHAFANGTRLNANCLIVLSPGVLGPTYFREVAVLAAKGAPEPEAMEALMRRHGLIPASPG